MAGVSVSGGRSRPNICRESPDVTQKQTCRRLARMSASEEDSADIVLPSAFWIYEARALVSLTLEEAQRRSQHRPRCDLSFVPSATGWRKITKKKAARLPGRPFLSHGGATFNGRSQNLCCRGPISRLILIGYRCSSGQSRSVARSVAMVSHLRKMTTVSLTLAGGATARSTLSPLFPLSTAQVQKRLVARARSKSESAPAICSPGATRRPNPPAADFARTRRGAR